uniref:BET1 homolog n=1 Tax=Eptatretus burgeri TaxID=7764 RepID=A0A8C4WXY1_EPTBU
MRRANTAEGVNYAGGGQRLYEEENEEMAQHLREKVTALKSLSIDIGNEVKMHNNLIGEMEVDFDSSAGLLGSTVGRLKKLAGGSQTWLMLYMMLFACFVFFVLYWVIRLR